MLFNIFESKNVDDVNEKVETPDVTEEEVEETVATEESMFDIMTEHVRDMVNLSAATIVSDVAAHHIYVTEGASQAQIFVENRIVDFFKSLKEKIVALWKKVIAWFKKLFQNIKIFFMSGKKFVDAYEAQIKSKNAKDFEIETYPMEKDGYGKVESAYISKAESVLGKYKGKLGQVITDKDEDVEGSGEDDFLKEVKASDMTDVYEEIDKLYGLEEKEEIKNFSKGFSKEDMIKKIKDQSAMEAKIKKAESESNRNFKDVMKMITDAEKAADKVENKSDADNANLAGIRKLISKADDIIATKNKLYSACLTREKQQVNECIRVLKAFMYSKEKVNNSYVPEMESFKLF